MSNPNIFTVYSPSGEPFETNRANARDLTTHAGWSFHPPEGIAACTVPPVKEEPKPESVVEEETSHGTSSEGSREVSAEEGSPEEGGSTVPAEESTSEEAGEEEVGGDADKSPATTGDFAALVDREAVVDYLAEHFPEFKPHHKSSRDGLVEKLVGLING